MTGLTEKRARDILEGIVGLASRSANADLKDFRVKDGGHQRTNRVKIDLYASVQNVKSNINTSAAKSGKLVRRLFLIWQEDENASPFLIVREWSYELDWGKSEYRDIWRKKLDEPGASREMSQMMSDSIRELVTKTE